MQIVLEFEYFMNNPTLKIDFEYFRIDNINNNNNEFDNDNNLYNNSLTKFEDTLIGKIGKYRIK